MKVRKESDLESSIEKTDSIGGIEGIEIKNKHLWNTYSFFMRMKNEIDENPSDANAYRWLKALPQYVKELEDGINNFEKARKLYVNDSNIKLLVKFIEYQQKSSAKFKLKNDPLAKTYKVEARAGGGIVRAWDVPFVNDFNRMPNMDLLVMPFKSKEKSSIE